MSHTAVIITVAYSIAVILGAAISFAVFRSTSRPLEEDRTGTWSRRETAWLVIMIVVLFALLMGTIFYVPYGDSAGPQRPVRAGHRGAVRLGDRGAADARHRPAGRIPRPLAKTSRTASASTTPTTF